MLTGRLQDEPTLTGRLQDETMLTRRLQDEPTLTRRLQDPPMLTEEVPPVALTEEIKAFIVRGLARYETPSQVAQALKATFGIEVSRQLVHTYNPQGARPVAERWVELHARTRERFLADLAEIGVAHKVVRLHMLDRFARLAEEHNHFLKAAGFLEQAAKECGGIYEGRKPAGSRRTAPADDAS
jgi:hypothetical protein